MNHTVTEITTESFTGRLGNAIAGIGGGALLFIAAFPLLFWNEGRSVDAARGLEEGAASVVAVAPKPVDPANEGRLVHVSGKVTVRAPVADPEFAVVADAVALHRRVEMYQWRQSSKTTTKKLTGGQTTRTTTYEYKPVWSDSSIESAGFKHPQGHENPTAKAFAGVSLETRKVVSEQASLGGFTLSEKQLRSLRGLRPLPLDEAFLNQLPQPLKGAARVNGRHLYLGGVAGAPAIGDLRVTFDVVPAAVASVVAQQRASTLAPFPTASGNPIMLVETGAVAATAMFETAEAQNTLLTWLIRLGGLLAMTIGLAMVLRPLSVVADVVPFIGNLVGVGTTLVAGVLGVGFATLTIAFAWLFYRPIVAGALVGIAVLALAGLTMLVQRRRQGSAPSPAPSSGANAPDELVPDELVDDKTAPNTPPPFPETVATGTSGAGSDTVVDEVVESPGADVALAGPPDVDDVGDEEATTPNHNVPAPPPPGTPQPPALAALLAESDDDEDQDTIRLVHPPSPPVVSPPVVSPPDLPATPPAAPADAGPSIAALLAENDDDPETIQLSRPEPRSCAPLAPPPAPAPVEHGDDELPPQYDTVVLPQSPMRGHAAPSASRPAQSAITEPLLLLRAMIAAAVADGRLDPREKAKIRRQASKTHFDGDMNAALRQELSAPWSVDRLVAACRDTQQGAKVYAAALFAVEHVSEGRQAFLESLTHSLGLTDETIAAVQRKFAR